MLSAGDQYPKYNHDFIYFWSSLGFIDQILVKSDDWLDECVGN